jgi:pimeloyl-ACP methyl ester carboxylesterase
VLGASFGGAVAQQMAVTHSSRVRRLVLVSTSFGGFAMPGNVAAMWHFINPGSYYPARLEKVAGTMFGGRLRTEPELVRSMHIQRPKNPWQAVYRMAPLFGWTSLPWLWAIRHPTLIVAGDDDPVTPHLNHRLMAALIPRAQLHTVRGGGHLALIDSAAEVAPVIASFLHADSGAAQDASDPRAAANGQLLTCSPESFGITCAGLSGSTCASKAGLAGKTGGWKATGALAAFRRADRGFR